MKEKFVDYNTALNTLERVQKVQTLTPDELLGISVMENELIKKINACDEVEQTILAADIAGLQAKLNKYRELKPAGR